MKPLVPHPDNIRLAMLGMVDGNGHPYSWSAIINGTYDAEAMASCGFPVIPQYLAAEPKENLGIPGVKAGVVHQPDAEGGQRLDKPFRDEDEHGPTTGFLVGERGEEYQHR